MDFPERGTTILETERLRLRLYQESDLEPFCAMNADPVVMRWLGGPSTAEHSLGRARAINAGFGSDGFGMMPLERKADGAFLGIAGLNQLDWYPGDVEVGWRLRPEAWGNGYATEAGRAWLGRAFERLGVARVISVADAPNLRSRAVMERLGMRLDHLATLSDDGDTFEAAVHALSREDWEAAGARGRA